MAMPRISLFGLGGPPRHRCSDTKEKSDLICYDLGKRIFKKYGFVGAVYASILAKNGVFTSRA